MRAIWCNDYFVNHMPVTREKKNLCRNAGFHLRARLFSENELPTTQKYVKSDCHKAVLVRFIQGAFSRKSCFALLHASIREVSL